MLYLVILALAIAAGVQAAPLLKPLFRVDNPMRDLERWWTARQLTTGWSRGNDEA